MILKIEIVSLYPWSILPLVVFCRPCQPAESQFKDDDVKSMMYSSLGFTNILFAAAFVYPNAKDNSRREISKVPFAFDVNSEVCGSQNKVGCYKHLLVHSFVFPL